MRAHIELGWVNKWFEAETPSDIFRQVEQYQDFDCLIMMGNAHETAAGQKELAKIEKVVEKYRSNTLMATDLKTLNAHLSIGNFICHELEEM